MKKIILNNNQELEVTSIYGGTQVYQNKERQYIKIVLSAENNSIDELNKIFSNENNTKSIKIIEEIVKEDNTITNEFIHNNYSIIIEISKNKMIIKKETDTNKAEYKDVINITLGQLTYTEIQQKEQTELVNATAEVLADLIGGAN